MEPQPIIILTAIMLEARAIARALNLQKVAPTRYAAAATGTRRQPAIELHVIGIRATQMPALPKEAPVILAGLAGALDPGLATADVVIEASVAPLPPWPGAFTRANTAAIPVRSGSIHCADHLIATVAEKKALFAATGALAVEMESTPVRRALLHRPGAAAPAPFAHLRAISDTAAESLDPALIGLVDPFGRPKPWTLAKTLITQPSMAAHLKRLGENAQRAAVNLATVLAKILESA